VPRTAYGVRRTTVGFFSSLLYNELMYSVGNFKILTYPQTLSEYVSRTPDFISAKKNFCPSPVRRPEFLTHLKCSKIHQIRNIGAFLHLVGPNLSSLRSDNFKGGRGGVEIFNVPLTLSEFDEIW